MGLVPIPLATMRAIPVDTRRVVLLVPSSGLSLLRAFRLPEIYLALSGEPLTFDNHFMSVHTAFVRVHRGESKVENDGHDWRSLSKNLAVRDTREDDLDAELMASAIVPTYALMMAPPDLTRLQLRPRDSVETLQAPKDIIARLGGKIWKMFYGSNLANKDRTAILTPGEPAWPCKGSLSSPPLACPKKLVSSWCEGVTYLSSTTGGSGIPESPSLQRSIHGKSVIDQSLELVSQPGHRKEASLAGRVKLVMVNGEAREKLAKGRVPYVESTQDPCSIRVVLGEELVHITRFPFPVACKDVRVVYTKSQGYAYFVVLPLEGVLEVPFGMTAVNVEDNGPRTLLSTFCWPACVPLASLRKLDFNAEWAHHEVGIDDGHVHAKGVGGVRNVVGRVQE